jgi:accessory gene regulator B
MKSSVTERLGELLVQNKVISLEEKELVIFGLQQGLIMILNVISSIIVGYIFGMVWQSIVFMVMYIPLRSYVGGYHARTQLRCYLFSIVLISLVLWGIKLIPWTSFICVVVSVVIGIIIFVFAPRADENKPLDEIEIVVFGKRARGIYLVQELILLIFLIIGWNDIAACIVMTFVAMGFMIFLDILNKSLRKSKIEEYVDKQY